MTRINSFIPPAELCDQHLLAEHREIKRIPNQIKTGRFKLESAPKNFTLGKGHVSFFYDKLWWLYVRYMQIYQECERRGFNVTFFGRCWEGLPDELMNWYSAEDDEIKRVQATLRKRISERMPVNPRFK